MKAKLIVASRLENLTKNGPMINVILGAPPGDADALPVKLEIGAMTPKQAASFPLGRSLEIVIPTYEDNNKEPSRIIQLSPV